MRRVLLDAILFLSLFTTPWWVSVVIALAGVFFFTDFYEIIFAGFIMDIVYGAPNASFLNVQFISTVAAIFLFAGGAFLKKRMVFYP